MTFISQIFRIISECLNSRACTRAIYKLIVILYWLELHFCKAMKSCILAKIKFTRTFPNLKYLYVAFLKEKNFNNRERT